MSDNNNNNKSTIVVLTVHPDGFSTVLDTLHYDGLAAENGDLEEAGRVRDWFHAFGSDVYDIAAGMGEQF